MATAEEKQAVCDIMAQALSPCVVELGAHLGEEEPWIRAACRDEVRYVMVEADRENHQEILTGGISPVRRVIHGAIADHIGSIEFYGSVEDGTGVRGSGSIRLPKLHPQLFRRIKFPEDLRQTVPCFTLDSIFDCESLSKIDLLWVDIQGAERDMIQGGAKALAHTHYLFIEVEDRELYEGMALKSELVAMLTGWSLIGDFDYNYLLRNDRFSLAYKSTNQDATCSK
jgi:FkbM family methyltransferase